MVAVEVSTFGDALRQLRLEAGLTQEELAERAGLSTRGLSDLERGLRRTPRLGTVRLLADALGLDARDRERLLASRQARCAWNAGFSPPNGDARARPPLLDVGHAEVASLVDRTRDVAELMKMLATRRVVTLTGPGGVGKTRLAMHLAGLVADQFADGVCLVDLSALSEDDLVPDAVAAALDVSDTHGSNPPSRCRVAEVLGSQHLLLVLDNCEQVIRGVAGLVAWLSRVCPSVTILSTSRERLAVGGEFNSPVDPLAVPPPDQAHDPEQATTYPAVQLFVERARAVVPGFELNTRNAAAVGEICRRLDGLPLAIELAAARTRLLSVQQIAARLDDRFRLLTNGARSAPSRHRALWDAIAWSYDLLSPPEQRLLRLISVFVGGFTLEALEAVAAPGPPVVDTLARLVDQSLVLVEHVGDTTRFGLLESVRAFAHERLDEAGETASAERERAAELLGSAARLRSTGANPSTPMLETFPDPSGCPRLLDSVRAALGPTAFGSAWHAGWRHPQA